MNRLAEETSPYLRQHADNPVDWYPWGDEAFERARAEDRPVLLSVGYSSCHWCHVMAHESFEDEATAAAMNAAFVNVKVDREERPDVDAVYMEAVQATTGRGGWPMTVFLTPDGRPFFAGTYFPDEERHGMPSFRQVLAAVAEAWSERRPALEQQADELAAAIRARTEVPSAAPSKAGAGTDGVIGPIHLDRPAAALPEGLVEHAARQLLDAHDPEWGGFGRAPKFPQTMALDVLLLAHRHDVAGLGEQALAAVTTSLDAMASGGIYDHLGGGFSRYSVDAFWMVPHFEKMLYDQALLVRAYTHGWQVTGHDRWRQVVEETIGYVLRDLRAPSGAVFSAEDADSEGEEGRFYVWRIEDVEDAIGAEAAALLVDWYGMTRSGNFEGSNILHRPERGALVRPPEVEAARAALLEARGRRVRPGLDDKVLTEWNALFVASLAEAGATFDRSDWIATAEEIGDALLATLRREDGRWLRSWQGGRARHLAYAADHAALVDAFTRLAEATGRARWIDEAGAVATELLDRFWDGDGGGVFTTAHDAERLLVRQKDLFDGATPSAGSMTAMSLLRLGALTGERRLISHGEKQLAVVGDWMAQQPSAFAHAVAAADLAVRGATEVVVPGDRPDLVREVQRRHLPDVVLAWGEPWASPLWEGRDEAAAYVCRGYVCALPARTPAELATQLAAGG